MPSPTSVSPERLNARATGGGMSESSVFHAEALWRAFARVRGHRVIDEPAWLVVDAGNDIGGTRVILRRPVNGGVQRASLSRLVEDAVGRSRWKTPSRASTCRPKALYAARCWSWGLDPSVQLTCRLRNDETSSYTKS